MKAKFAWVFLIVYSISNFSFFYSFHLVQGKHTVLGPKSSSSFKSLNKTWSITYGSGDVAGDLVQDNVAFGDLKLTAHKFGVARNESDDFSA